MIIEKKKELYKLDNKALFEVSRYFRRWVLFISNKNLN